MIARDPIPASIHRLNAPLIVIALIHAISFASLAMASPWNEPERVTRNAVEDRTTSGSLIHACFDEAYAVWLQEQGAPGWRLMWSKRDGDGWQEPQPINPGTHPDYEPRLGNVPGFATISAVWQRGSGAAAEIIYGENFGKGWTVQPITTNATEDITPDLPAENLNHIVWAGFDPQSQQGRIHYAFRTGVVWNTEVLTASQPGPFWTGAAPRIDVGPDGVVHVVYRGGDFGDYHLHYARKEGNIWTYQILTSLNGNDLSVDVATHASTPHSSDVFVAMSGNDCFGCPTHIYLRTSTDNGLTFGPPDLLSGTFSAGLENLVEGVVGPAIAGSEVSGNIYTGNLLYAVAGQQPELLPPSDQANETPSAGQSLCIAGQPAGYESVLFTNHENAGSDSAEVYFLASPGGGGAIDEGTVVAATGFQLRASPNPFSAWTRIEVEDDSKDGVVPPLVEGAVYDIAGRVVQRLGPAATLQWDGTLGRGQQAPAGTYWITVHAGKQTATTAVVRVP